MDQRDIGEMVDWEAARELFPSLSKYTYLNTASGGAMSAYAAAAARQYYDESHALADTLWDDWLARAEAVRARLAAFLNTSPEELAFLPNASLGLNLAAHLFEGEIEVLTTEDEFPSGTLPWLARGHTVRFLPTADDGSIAPEAIAEAISPRSRVLVTSFVQYKTGFRHDLAALGRLCRDHGLPFIVDATQGAGAFSLDVRSMGIDALVFSGYKWAGAGYGIAALFIDQKMLADRPLPMVGWRSAASPYALSNDQLALAAHTTALELGHPLFPGIFALGGALRLFEEIGAEAITARVLDLAGYLHERLGAHHIPVLSTTDPAHRSGITMVGVAEPKAVAEALAEEGVMVAARGAGLRVAVHFYNTHADVDRFVEVLGRILARTRP